MECTKCGGKLVRQRLGRIDGCLGLIAEEAVFWLIAGIVAIAIHKLASSAAIFVTAFIILLLLAHYLDRRHTTYRCQACGSVFTKTELKNKQG